MILEHRAHLDATGLLAERRRAQVLDWMHELIAIGLEDLFRADPSVTARLPQLQAAVQNGSMTPFAVARELLSTFGQKRT